MQTSTIAGIVCPRCGTVCADDGSICPACGTGLRTFPGQVSLVALLLRAICVVMIFAMCVVGGTWYFLRGRLLNCGAYQEALKVASASPEVQRLIGSNIQAKSVFGHVEAFGATQFAEWSVTISGNHDSGHLIGIANQVNGVWDFSRLVLESSTGKGQIDLTPLRLLPLPKVPEKKVYLLPLGLEAGESLDWAPNYYKSRLGIDLELLPAAKLDPKLIDLNRDQLNTDITDGFLKQKYPDIAGDPSAILIAVTSKDMYIPTLGWTFAENMRHEGRLAIVSSARLHPPVWLEELNKEWLNSRVEKLLTKNIVMLYFGLPMSSDYTSLLSGGVLSGREIDEMGGSVIGADRRWNPFIDSGAPSISIYDAPGKNPVWTREWSETALPDTAAQVFSVSLDVGLMVQRKADFVFPGEPTMQFTRIYRNQDDRSRAFGIGGSHAFDMFLGGQMGVAVDLIAEDGHRTHFMHQTPQAGQRGDTYRPDRGSGGRFIDAVYAAGNWEVHTIDGWTYNFPYRPQALPQYVTVLTSFTDPDKRRYDMERDSFGALLDINSPTGSWLHFANDSEHRIRKITSSTGRSVEYDYDLGGRLFRATPSDGQVDSYTYDDKAQMLTASYGDDESAITNQYFVDGYIKSQTMKDGRSFQYHYFRDSGHIRENQITDPNGLETYVEYGRNGYREWLPSAVPH